MADNGRSELDAAVSAYLLRVAEAIKSDAKDGCPRDTGELAESIDYEISSDGRSARIGTNVPYALATEYGSKPHIIRPNGHPFLKFPGHGGKDVFAREVHHPGTPEQPFLRPALFRQRGAL